jgi:oligopeptidase B
VPYVVIKERGVTPKAQFIYVYGAYGSSTPVNWPYQHWYPLLKRKWAIVFSMVRGGGDVDAAWAEAARRENRHVSIEDFEAVIRASQQKYHLGPDKTVIYGRSAGGLPIGAIVSRFPNGELVGAAFTEVPYVDVLRTSSNPDLPLTKGEYEDFGNPSNKILQFKELLSVSPINTLPADGAPGVFVMSRVGLLDEQVFAYESFKWIQKLRGMTDSEECRMVHPKGKYVTFEKEEAHVYKPRRFPRFRAIDLAILNAWVDGSLRF